VRLEVQERNGYSWPVCHLLD